MTLKLDCWSSVWKQLQGVNSGECQNGSLVLADCVTDLLWETAYLHLKLQNINRVLKRTINDSFLHRYASETSFGRQYHLVFLLDILNCERFYTKKNGENR